MSFPCWNLVLRYMYIIFFSLFLFVLLLCWWAVILQHPTRARCCGFGEKDKRPLDPPAILLLYIENSQESLQNVRYKRERERFKKGGRFMILERWIAFQCLSFNADSILRMANTVVNKSIIHHRSYPQQQATSASCRSTSRCRFEIWWEDSCPTPIRSRTLTGNQASFSSFKTCLYELKDDSV